MYLSAPIKRLWAFLETRKKRLDKLNNKRKEVCTVGDINIDFLKITWDQALISFRFENYIPAGKAKRKESLIQTFYETSAAHFFDWLTFAESAKQNYFHGLYF